MANLAPTRLENLLAALALGLHDDSTRALEEAAQLTGSGPTALLALDEFLGGANVRRLADVLGLTHSGAVRLVALLENEGLVERWAGEDRRNVEVRLTGAGRRRAARARAARDEVVRRVLAGVDVADVAVLERIMGDLVGAGVQERMRGRAEGRARAWWCRTCDFGACGRPDGRCPAQTTAAAANRASQ
jgi:MarR family transcriptional repressor of emrRAB